jgi:hypothetical protein
MDQSEYHLGIIWFFGSLMGLFCIGILSYIIFNVEKYMHYYMSTMKVEILIDQHEQ